MKKKFKLENLKFQYDDWKNLKAPFYAIKGFEKGLKCRGETFELNTIYEKQKKDIFKPLQTCTNQGWHYCQELSQVHPYYNINDRNEFAIIEVLGENKNEYSKGVTTKFKIVEKIPNNVISSYSEYFEKIYPKNKTFKYNLKSEFELIKHLQRTNSTCHIGGSLGLFLHGFALNRLKSWNIDLDIIMPYFQLPHTNNEIIISSTLKKNSGNDFNYFYNARIKGGSAIKIDVKIDNTQAYEIINYGGFDYKVSPLAIILAAKLKYSSMGNEKHTDDLEEILENEKGWNLKKEDKEFIVNPKLTSDFKKKLLTLNIEI